MRKNKYGATRVEYDNHSFSSKLEASVYTMLKVRENAGEIKDIKAQISIYLTEAKIQYIVDFMFIDVKTGSNIYCEAKGMETSSWRIKRKLWMFYGPGPLEIYKGTHLRPFLHEIIKA